MRVLTGGFRYSDIPVRESGLLLESHAVIETDGRRVELGPGEGYVLEPGFTGSYIINTPTTKVFYVL